MVGLEQYCDLELRNHSLFLFLSETLINTTISWSFLNSSKDLDLRNHSQFYSNMQFHDKFWTVMRPRIEKISRIKEVFSTFLSFFVFYFLRWNSETYQQRISSNRNGYRYRWNWEKKAAHVVLINTTEVGLRLQFLNAFFFFENHK